MYEGKIDRSATVPATPPPHSLISTFFHTGTRSVSRRNGQCEARKDWETAVVFYVMHVKSMSNYSKNIDDKDFLII